MKLKDLPEDKPLIGTKIKIPIKIRKEQELPKTWMTIYSGWNKGLWLKTNLGDERIYPFTFDEFSKIENYEVKK